MNIIPINSHLLIEPVTEQGAFQSSQQTYEERGKVLAVAVEVPPFFVGVYVYFDSWTAAKYKDGEGNEHWVVPYSHVRAYES